VEDAKVPGQKRRRDVPAKFVLGPIGLIVVCLVLGLGTTTCARGCGAVNGETEVALGALQHCAKAKEIFGDDVDFATVGCATYHSRSGGDPVNEGCMSASSWRMPIAGSKNRGVYIWSYSSTPQAPHKFGGGSMLSKDGQTVSVRADGSCR
jgi:hypothetical protein